MPISSALRLPDSRTSSFGQEIPKVTFFFVFTEYRRARFSIVRNFFRNFEKKI